MYIESKYFETTSTYTYFPLSTKFFGLVPVSNILLSSVCLSQKLVKEIVV